MFNKIIFYNLILNFLTLSVVQSAESGGMPQLNPEFWVSQIFWLTLTFAIFIFIGVTILGFVLHGFKYLKIFVPSGVPIVLLPIITIIEIISYLSRPISLSVRLFANMMAGHTTVSYTHLTLPTILLV